MGLSLGGLISSAVQGFGDLFTGDVGGLQEDFSQGVSSLGLNTQQLQQAGAFIGAETGFDPSSLIPSGGAGTTVYRDTGEIVSGGGGGGGGLMQANMLTAIPALVMSSIIKLSQKFGGAGRSPLAYGKRIWESLYAWASKNPGVSLIGLLTGVGLTVEEAAHFLAWGATKKKRRRRRGISAANLRTTRRTLRTIVRMYHSLPHGSSPRRTFGGSRTSIVKA